MKRPELLLLLLLAACSTTPAQVVLAPLPNRPGLPRGIDMPIDSRDVSNELKGRGLEFVARYYRDPASRWPTLTRAEADALSAAGFKIVAIWESHSHKPEYFSYASGFADGVNASRQARSVGQPPGSAIYFAVDYNASGAAITGPIDSYFRGIAAGLASVGVYGQYRIGVYGSGSVCSYLKSARLAQYAWLSNSSAWYGYKEFFAWNIRQRPASPSLSFGHDQNEARSDYGGFQVGSRYSSL